MFEWLIRRRFSGPTSDFLRCDDFETVWGASFRWCNREIPETEPASIPDDTKQVAYRLIRGFFEGHLNLWTPDGLKVQGEPYGFFLKDRNPWRKLLFRCIGRGQFEVPLLSKLYIERGEVISWCEEEKLAPPSFWAKGIAKETGSKKLPLENRLRDDDIDRLVCQAIARAYWDIDPNIHPAHMAAARAVKLYGNGKQYKDDNTVKSWIVEVDPRKGQRKTGRPENIPYRIDLETGGLAE